MNVKQTSYNNQNINWGQSETFDVCEQITDGEKQYIVCTKQKRIKISPLYKIHKTKKDEVFYKIELQKVSPLIIGGVNVGEYETIHSETYNVSSAEMKKFMNFLSETFALESVDVNTFVSVDSKGVVREILRKYQSDKTLFEALPMADLDTINGNVTLQNLKNIRNDMKENMETGGEIEYWHPFLKKYNWILSQLFITPYILFQDEFYVGGKRYDRKGEVRVDFGMKNIRTGNCAIIEIKDAKQELVTSYRTGEYRISNALSGAISQILKQKDILYKDYWQNAVTHGSLAFSANNIKSILIIGTVPQSEEEIKTFDSFRNELKGIEIITFDEMLKKIELQIQIMEGTVFEK